MDTRIAFCFPDTYEIGMSNLGMRILYGVMNEMPGVWCERVFAPWGDMEEEMREAHMPLFALESGDPLDAISMSWPFPWAMRWPITDHPEHAGSRGDPAAQRRAARS